MMPSPINSGCHMAVPNLREQLVSDATHFAWIGLLKHHGYVVLTNKAQQTQKDQYLFAASIYYVDSVTFI